MSEFVNYLKEVLAPFGIVQAKRMFGGYGLYHEGLMFALVADDVLYLKADQQSVGAFAELGLTPFSYDRNGKRVSLSYYTAPESIFSDAEQAKKWAALAFAAALRANKRKPNVKTKSK